MNMKRAKTQQTGSMILEALVAILIFSIGILSLIGMQATAINTVADSKDRSTAGFLANQIVGTIWAGRIVSTSASNVVVAAPDGTFACNPCNSTTGNAYTQAWVQSGVQANLPSGTAIISMVGPTVTVTVGWTPPSHNAGQAAIAHKHVVETFIN